MLQFLSFVSFFLGGKEQKQTKIVEITMYMRIYVNKTSSEAGRSTFCCITEVFCQHTFKKKILYAKDEDFHL